MDSGESVVRREIEAELDQPVAPGIAVIVGALCDRFGDRIAAILFYGSCLRSGEDEGGLIDLYVLVRRYRDFHESTLSALVNRLLPPNVYYIEATGDGRTVRAKYAVLSLDDLDRGTRPEAPHSSIWGRFAQPCALVHSESRNTRERVALALAAAVRTMLGETAPLLPENAGPEALWKRAFRESYRTELRAERANRPADLYEVWGERYDRLATAIKAAGILRHGPVEKKRALRRWRRRRIVGKALHVLRLAKATFTFAGGMDYILWKIEKHSGVSVQPTHWQRRHPLLAAPGLAMRLYRRGAFR